MMNRFKIGELVIINGRGKLDSEENNNVLGIIKEKDYYFNQYYVEVLFGQDDWFKEEDLKRVFEKKNRKSDKFKVGLVLEKKGFDYIVSNMNRNDEKTIDLFEQADIIQPYKKEENEYILLLWGETYWPETNYTVQEIEKALPTLKKENIPYQYIVIGITDPKLIKVEEFIKNDKNVDILEVSTNIKIKKFGGII